MFTLGAGVELAIFCWRGQPLASNFWVRPCHLNAMQTVSRNTSYLRFCTRLCYALAFICADFADDALQTFGSFPLFSSMGNIYYPVRGAELLKNPILPTGELDVSTPENYASIPLDLGLASPITVDLVSRFPH